MTLIYRNIEKHFIRDYFYFLNFKNDMFKFIRVAMILLMTETTIFVRKTLDIAIIKGVHKSI